MPTSSFRPILVAVLAAPALQAQQPALLPPPTQPPPVIAPGQPSLPALPPTPAVQATIGTVTPGDFTFVVVDPATGVPVAKPPETRFDLDFPGGTPEQFVREIEAAGVGTLNVIIPRELADTEIPAVRVRSVTVPQLFEALTEASRKTVTYSYDAGAAPQPFRSYQQKETSFGFRTRSQPGPDSIWVFYVERPPANEAPPARKVVRFYQVAPYLDEGAYTVDDITTAIQTGWRMLGDDSPPTLNFHQDTKLLIALGTESQLRTIEDVLAQLRPSRRTPSAPAASGSAGPLPASPRVVPATPPAQPVPAAPTTPPSKD